MQSQDHSLPCATVPAIESACSRISRVASRCLAVGLIALSVGACAPVWIKNEASNVSASGEGPQGKSGFKAPVGWLRITMHVGGVVLMSKDGEGIQQMRLAQNKPEQMVPASKIKIAATASPEDISKAFQAEIKSSLGGTEVQPKSTVPITLSGLPGFRTHFAFRDQRGTPREMVVAGAKRGDEIFYLAYQALSIHYFQRDLPVFDETLASIKLR